MRLGQGMGWLGAMLLLFLCITPQAARATGVDLHHAVCTATLPDRATDDDIRTAPYRCGPGAPTRSDHWIWLRLDAGRLRALPPDWQLLIDQTRFDRIAILIDGRTGVRRVTRSAGDLHDHWAPGGLLRFPIASRGADIRALYLGFHRIDDLSLMRKVAAVPTAEQTAANEKWLLLIGLFAGTLVSALVYNLVIYMGRRPPFQRWYLLWASVAFAYGMIWTNGAAFLIPWLVGPVAVRCDFVLVGLLVGAGNMFLFSVLEDGILPPIVPRAGRLLAASGALLGMAAAADGWFPPVLADRLLNVTVAGTMVTLMLSSFLAARRGSRVIWFYLIGWTPVIAVFLLRLARNLGLMPQDDLVDMATFVALAFEALVLSVAIADRFRSIRRELQFARQRREIDLAEAQALRVAAHTDFLTGLGNRLAFQSDAQALIAQGHAFTLFLIDIDYLKDVNDRLGHAGGDALLGAVADLLRTAMATSTGTRIARIGGDEFAILAPGDATLDILLRDRLAGLQGTAWRFLEQDSRLSLSIGSVRFPQDAQALDMLYQNADLALYNAKKLGRGRHFRYAAPQRILHELQVEFMRDAEAALQRDEFHLHFQPIVALPAGKVIRYEALLRWQHPHHGLITPDRFADLMVSEKIGLRVQDHVLDRALATLRDHGDDMAALGVNFTAAQLSGPQSARHVLDRLAHHGLDPSALCIEITEAVMLDRAADTILATLRTLHDAGIRIALDDFGTGQASLAHLRGMPVDDIKIDRSFVAGLDDAGGGTTAIVRAILGLGHGLGKQVIAEGVETEAQARRLMTLGCQLAQGYLYGRPTPAPLPQPDLAGHFPPKAAQPAPDHDASFAA